MADPDSPTQAEVQKRLGRPFEQVRAQLEELFDEGWEEIEVVIETSASKHGRSRADVIVELVSRAERKSGVQSRVRRSLVRWIGKPWRERANPWDRFKDRLPPVPPKPRDGSADLDEWTPLRPDED